jgi:hypothetical protein
MKKFLVLAAVLATSVSAFAFQPGMTAVQINTEVTQRSARGESTALIAAAAKAAGLSGTAVQAALVAAGKEPEAVFTAMLNADFDPGSLLPPTAAGRREGGEGNERSPGFNGFGRREFGESRSSTVGGGGRGGVSRS